MVLRMYPKQVGKPSIFFSIVDEKALKLYLHANRSKKALVFNMTGNRDGLLLMKHLIQCRFDYAYFCPNIIEQEGNSSVGPYNNFMSND